LDGENKEVNSVLDAITAVFILPVMIPLKVCKTDLSGSENGYWNDRHLRL
jgi:hypothetical protein